MADSEKSGIKFEDLMHILKEEAVKIYKKLEGIPNTIIEVDIEFLDEDDDYEVED